MYHELNQLIQPVTCKYFYATLITQGGRRRAGGGLGGAVDWEPGRSFSNVALPKNKVPLPCFFDHYTIEKTEIPAFCEKNGDGFFSPAWGGVVHGAVKLLAAAGDEGGNKGKHEKTHKKTSQPAWLRGFHLEVTPGFELPEVCVTTA